MATKKKTAKKPPPFGAKCKDCGKPKAKCSC